MAAKKKTSRTEPREDPSSGESETGPVRVCFDRHLDGLESILSSVRAAAEWQAHFASAESARSVAANALDPNRLALITSKKYPPGKVLRTSFIGGDGSIYDRVIDVANDWVRAGANLRIVRTNDADAEIRISFAPSSGAWSYIGQDALGIPIGKATMNLGWINRDSTDADHGTTRHEFGHAIGAIHEHQSPAGGVNWNKEAVYRDLGGPPNNWSREQINHNIFAKHAAGETQFTHTDRTSIMMYFFPVSWTTDGYSTPNNTQLSDVDKAWIKQQYPGGVTTDERAEINKLVIANLQAVFIQRPFPPGIIFAFIAEIKDHSGDGYSDVVGLIGLQTVVGRRKVNQLFRIVYDGLSPIGGTIGPPTVIGTF